MDDELANVLSLVNNHDFVDEMANVLLLVSNHNFVQEVVYTMGDNKPSFIIFYAKDHITDLHSEMNTIIGVERGPST